MNRPFLRKFIRGALTSGALALLLAACIQEDTRGICPRVAILDQTSVLTAFRDGAPETQENVRYTAQLTDIAIECRYEDSGLRKMDADVEVAIVVRRGPALRSDRVPIRYFIAITDTRGNVLTKEVFDFDVDLEGQDAVRVVDRTLHDYNLDRAGTGYLYETWAGFQLTDRQLEYVRRQSATAGDGGS